LATTSLLVFVNISAICCAIFMLTISKMAVFRVPVLPRGDLCPYLHPLMPFLVGLLFLRYSGRLPPRSLNPLMFSWRDRSLLLSMRALWACRSTLSAAKFFLIKFILGLSLLHDASSLFRRRSIYSEVHNFTGSQFF
jgi:hypothetical protein